MATPYTSGPHVVSATGGEESCIELRCPSRGTIQTLKFDHVSGVDANCAFEVYTKSAACTPGASSSSSSASSAAAAAAEAPPSAYSIFGEKTYTAGTPIHETDKHYSYQNNDAGPTNRARKLYLRLLPSGSGAKDYAITFEIEVSPLT